ncbi:hypothetical protein C1Y40_05575 [Mycobacterium talmoniae]|uniref:Uncharacterized protein n=1 Tax=Mycobacterium talmoniae TaxID=1858794 RepID=A0A2S8BC96_9MYCO|nr:hypothetical protein C1Y40_05575 [Mycobacterium talmoniae]
MDQRAGQARFDVVERFEDLFGAPIDDVPARRPGDQVDERVERLGREHRVGANVGMRLLGRLVDLHQRRHAGDRRGLFTLVEETFGQRQRKVAAGGVAGQHDLVGRIALLTQPLIPVVAVVDGLADRMLGQHPVVHHQHRAVGILRQLGDQPTVGVGAAGDEGAAVQVEHHAAGAVGRQHPGGTDQLGGALRQPDGGADGARRRKHRAGGDIEDAPRPRRVRQVATDGQGWPNGKTSGQPGESTGDPGPILDDLDGGSVADWIPTGSERPTWADTSTGRVGYLNDCGHGQLPTPL